MSHVVESEAVKERCRIQSVEVSVRLAPPERRGGRGGAREAWEAKLFLSFNGRAFLRGNISTRQEHTGPFTISRIGTCARLHFGRLAPHRRETSLLHRASISRGWIVLKNELGDTLLEISFLDTIRHLIS